VCAPNVPNLLDQAWARRVIGLAKPQCGINCLRHVDVAELRAAVDKSLDQARALPATQRSEVSSQWSVKKSLSTNPLWFEFGRNVVNKACFLGVVV